MSEPANNENGAKISDSPTTDSNAEGMLEILGRKLDEIPEIKAAEEAVLKAKEELEKAIDRCRTIEKETKQAVSDLRNKSVGQLIDDSLGYVKKHPAQGMLLAGLFGVILGRWFRR